LALALGMMGALWAYSRGGRGQDPQPRAGVKRPAVASLVPAATDLIVGMGAQDHLVAVSYYDVEREGTRGLPKVGDYQDFDWEQIARVRPDVMVVFMSPERVPAALKQRADAMNIRLVNVRTERLEEVFSELGNLGQILGERAKADQAAARLRGELHTVARRVAGEPRVPVLIVRETTLDGGVGRENFLDDALNIAGGRNVIAAKGWPVLDREQLLASRPEVVLHLLPGASEQAVKEANRAWAAMPEIPAVKNNRVYVLTEWWLLQPGMQIGKTASRFADLIHGS
jgi:iron complex transport system substrate-binding protein